MPPSSALSLPVSAAPACQLSRANRPRKRKSSAEQLLLCAFVALVNVLHKTDGSYVNRPFFRSGQDVRESIFSQKDILPRYVFCFFSSRKEIVPPSFLFRRKNGQLAREAQPLRRTSSFLFRRKEAKENHLRKSYYSALLPFPPTCHAKRTVRM